MEKYEAKEVMWEEQREMLVDFTALQLPKTPSTIDDGLW